MILAETIATNVNWTLIATIIMAVAAAGAWVDTRRQLNKPTSPTQIEQPLQVQKIWPAATLAELRDAMKQTNERIDRQQEQIDKISEIIRLEIPEMVEKVNLAGESRIRRVHSRLDPLIIGVAQLCAKNGIKMPQPHSDE